MILLSRREHREATDGDVHRAVWQPAAEREGLLAALAADAEEDEEPGS
jgi:hypothetical protein